MATEPARNRRSPGRHGGREQSAQSEDGTNSHEQVMAVVHVKAPAEVDPHLIEAELVRAINGSGTRPLTVELVLAAQNGPRPRGKRHRHGFVAVLMCGVGPSPSQDLGRQVQKTARKALRRRFGAKVTAEVNTDINGWEADAYWCSLRGTPHRIA